MKINKIQIIILILAVFLAVPVFARAENKQSEIKKINFGEYEVEYNTSEEIAGDHTVYKLGENIVLSVFDTDGNGKNDLWLRYNENFVLDLEASDITGDGVPDTIFSINSEEDATELAAPEFTPEKVVLPENPNPKKEIKKTETKNSDVFVLAPPPTENKFGFSFKWIFAVLLLGVAVLIKMKSWKKLFKKK